MNVAAETEHNCWSNLSVYVIVQGKKLNMADRPNYQDEITRREKGSDESMNV